MRRLSIVLLVSAVACTEVGTDPNAVVALRFDGSAYPSIVAGDSLRDSLGLLQPLQVTALNYKGEPVAGATAAFSSPDTGVRITADGVVISRGPKADASPVRVFATIGSLQSQPDSLFVVPRADSIRADKDVELGRIAGTLGSTGADSLRFFVYGHPADGGSPVAVPSWLVSFQLKYHGVVLSPTDTSVAFVGETVRDTLRTLRFVDTTDTQGKAGHRVFVKSIPASVSEDTIFLIATIRTRASDAPPLSAETMILLRRQ